MSDLRETPCIYIGSDIIKYIPTYMAYAYTVSCVCRRLITLRNQNNIIIHIFPVYGLIFSCGSSDQDCQPVCHTAAEV